MIGRTVHEIPLIHEKVTYVKERRYLQALRQRNREELDKKQGVIVDSTSPYSSPYGQWCWCLVKLRLSTWNTCRVYYGRSTYTFYDTLSDKE